MVTRRILPAGWGKKGENLIPPQTLVEKIKPLKPTLLSYFTNIEEGFSIHTGTRIPAGRCYY